MSPMRDFVQRFRPAGTPGKAAGAAVPADRARDLARELEPVLALLADMETERAATLADAARDAKRIRDDAHRQADDMVVSARQRAQGLRADAATSAVATAEADAAVAIRAARREAQATRERASARMPGYVNSAVRAVRDLARDSPVRDSLAGDSGTGRARGGAR
ncbi:MAG: hypothetical protein ACM3ML_33585 [Micromonosporaceae bacterium]